MDKKICMVNINDAKALFDRPTGGIKRFWELYSFLCSEGYKVDVYCACSERELQDHNINGYSLNIKNKGNGVFSAPSLSIYFNNRKQYREIKKENYNCVISFDVPSTTTVCLAKLKNINFFIRQDLIKYRRIQYKKYHMSKILAYIRLFLGWIMEGICISRSERIISQCQIDLDSVYRRHPFLRAKIKRSSRIQINNINPSWIQNTDSTESFNKKYDIGFVGNFDDDRKGAGILLEALDQLFRQGFEYTAVFIGDGKKREIYKKRYAYLDKLEFVAYVKNPLEYIRSMRLMIVPSIADSCPNTVLEALSCGTPVIGSNCGGIPEILTNTDWLFDLDKNVLSKKIMDIFENKKTEELACEQGSKAKELTFNWGKAIEKCLVFH